MFARRRGHLRIQLARAGAARSDHLVGAGILGCRLVCDHDPRCDRLQPAVDRGRRSFRGVRVHRRRTVGLATDRRKLALVNPLAGLSSWTPPPGAAGVVAALLGSTAYDSFANTSWWIQTVQDSDLPSLAWQTAGLLAMIIIVLASFALAACWMGPLYLATSQRLSTADGRVGRAHRGRLCHRALRHAVDWRGSERRSTSRIRWAEAGICSARQRWA